MLSGLLCLQDGELRDSRQSADPRPWERAGISAGVELRMIEGGSRRSSDIILDQHVETRKAMCLQAGCPAYARGRAGYCAVHGGAARCQVAEGCAKAARPSSRFCGAHGGGKRCTHQGCSKLAQGLTSMCLKHGGGYRCTYKGCTKGSRGSCGLCRKHMRLNYTQQQAHPLHRPVLERMTEVSLPTDEARNARHMQPMGHDAGLQGQRFQGWASLGPNRPLDCSGSAIAFGASLPHWSRGSAAPMQNEAPSKVGEGCGVIATAALPCSVAERSLTLGSSGRISHMMNPLQFSLEMAPQLPPCAALLDKELSPLFPEKELLPLFPMQSPVMTEGHSQHSMISHLAPQPPTRSAQNGW